MRNSMQIMHAAELGVFQIFLETIVLSYRGILITPPLIRRAVQRGNWLLSDHTSRESVHVIELLTETVQKSHRLRGRGQSRC